MARCGAWNNLSSIHGGSFVLKEAHTGRQPRRSKTHSSAFDFEQCLFPGLGVVEFLAFGRKQLLRSCLYLLGHRN